MTLRSLTVGVALTVAVAAQNGDRAGDPQTMLPDSVEVPPAIARSPAEELATFRVAAGYRVELVASEPMIADPVAATFDAAGRLWVCEWRSYMKDVEATDESEPTGRIVVLHDRDGDGRMDDVSVFLDQLVLPRAVMPMRGGALMIEPPNLYWCPDADGDLRADGKELITDGFQAGIDNPEHSGNGLLWGLDHRIHIAGDKRLVRWTGDGFEIEAGSGGGQWGITHDDRGRFFFNYNSDWLRCDLVPGRHGPAVANLGGLPGLNHQVVKNQSTWPIRITPGINRGYQKGMLRDWKLARTTGVCSPHVYRGDVLPCDGDVFVCEPCGNLVRRFVMTDADGVLRGENPYEADQGEFLASTDERFRPVNLFGGQDGGLYVLDMYRGVIQHRNYVTSYLRHQIEKRGLEQPIHMGRIWRVVPEGHVRRVQPPVADAPLDRLIAALGSHCGTTRDLALRELVQRKPRAAAPALRQALAAHELAACRIVLLSALDGLGALERHDLRRAMGDDDTGVQCMALQLAAPHLIAGDGLLWAHCEISVTAGAPGKAWQAALTMGEILRRRTAAKRHPDALDVLVRALTRDEATLRQIVAMQVADRPLELLKLIAAAPNLDHVPYGSREPVFLPGRKVAAYRELARMAIKTRTAATQSAVFAFAAERTAIDEQEALLRGALDALPKPKSRQGWLTFPATPAALLAIVRANDAGAAPLASELLAAVALEVGSVGAAVDVEVTPAQRKILHAGERVFASVCAACHQLDGNGMQGLAPPLRDSEWVTGPPQRLIRIALHGVKGPIEAAGEEWDREMPGQGHFADADIAAALSYLRRAFGHRQSMIGADDVAAERKASGRRTEPWTAAELFGDK